MDLYFYISKIFSPLIVPSNFFVFTLIIFFYMGIYKNKTFFKKLFTYIFIFFSLITIFPVGNTLIYHFLEKDFINTKIQKNIDYIFVPAGGRDRLIKAIAIKNEHNLENVKIIYSSGNPWLDKNQSEDGEINFVKDLFLISKIKREDFIFLPEARNSIENFSRLNQYLFNNDNKDNKILLITHGYHLKRSLMLAKKYNLEIYPFSSMFVSTSQIKGLINNYQKINVISNLKNFNIFVKEMISSSLSYLFIYKK